jgi:hypothetical protein
MLLELDVVSAYIVYAAINVARPCLLAIVIAVAYLTVSSRGACTAFDDKCNITEMRTLPYFGALGFSFSPYRYIYSAREKVPSGWIRFKIFGGVRLFALSEGPLLR